MSIREAKREDFDQIWPIFHQIAAAGETYAYPPRLRCRGPIIQGLSGADPSRGQRAGILSTFSNP